MNQIDCFLSDFRLLDKNFKKKFRESHGSGSFESIHQLRVTIKKIKAFFHLLEHLNPGFNSNKSYSKFKKIFKSSGALRECQIRMGLFNSIEIKMKVHQHFQRSELTNKEKKEWQRFNRSCLKTKIGFHKQVRNKALKTLRKNLTVLKVKLYMDDQLTRIICFMKRQDKRKKKWHRLRILLKEYMYNMTLVNNCMLKNKVIRDHMLTIHKLQDDIGKWHDQAAMLKYIEQSQKQLPLNEKRSLNLFYKKMIDLNQKIILRLNKQFPSILSSFEHIKMELL